MAALLLVGAALPALGQPPVNDDFANATVVPEGACAFSDMVCTVDATNEPNDPDAACTLGSDSNTVWYVSTQPADCMAIYDTCDSDYDTVLSIWTGTQGNLIQVACRDDKSIFEGTSKIMLNQ